ncbi:MAG: hypothetical protein E6Q76_16900 [Rhizobium sp.]|nr:MAG: hypothetical protein E6Q76_16900 [Rhizobium sp.]
MNYELIPGTLKTKTRLGSKGQLQTSHTAQYRIYSDESPWPGDAKDAFTSLSGIGMFVAMDSDPTAKVRVLDVTGEKIKSPWTFVADVEWSTETPDEQQQDRENDDPFDDAIEFESDGEITTFPIWKDLDDKPLVNAVGEPITGLEQERNIEIVRLTRNEHSYDPERCRRFRGAINLYEFYGAAPDCVRIRKISVRRMFRNRIEYYPHTYELAYREDGWLPKLLHAGLYQLKYSGDTIVGREPCLDINNEPVSEPVPLSGPPASELDQKEGLQIPASSLPSAAYFKEYRTIERRDFAELNLPRS